MSMGIRPRQSRHRRGILPRCDSKPRVLALLSFLLLIPPKHLEEPTLALPERFRVRAGELFVPGRDGAVGAVHSGVGGRGTQTA